MFEHFLEAQKPVIDKVISELSNGKKETHWMWFIFPQIKGLGSSEMSKKFAINNLKEAKEYLEHPVLGKRLIECTQLILESKRDIDKIFGWPDNEKFISCMTLFCCVKENDIFSRALTLLNKGKTDSKTFDILNKEPIVANKAPAQSDVEATYVIQPQDTNARGTAFGGKIMQWMDSTAAISAIRHCRKDCVTVSVDRLHFAKPIHLGDIVIVKARVNYTGTTSMEVGVKVCKEAPLSGERIHCLTGYFSFVAIENDSPVAIPSIHPETEEDKRRWIEAQARRKDRLGGQ